MGVAIVDFASLRATMPEMIPPFDANGVLPPGVHPAGLTEIAECFARTSEIRRVQMESVRWLVDLARHAGALRIVLNGSFVTDIIEPNDVDCVVLLPAASENEAVAEIRIGLPFLEVALVGQDDFDELVNFTFASDRFGQTKGMVEVLF